MRLYDVPDEELARMNQIIDSTLDALAKTSRGTGAIAIASIIASYILHGYPDPNDRATIFQAIGDTALHAIEDASRSDGETLQ